METKNVTALPGVFTPAGEVVCLNCHGQFLKWGHTRRDGNREIEGWAQRDVPRPLRCNEGGEPIEGVTTCDRCLKQIAVRKDVAAIKNFGLTCDEAEMDALGGFEVVQAGGMIAGMYLRFVSADGGPTGKFIYISDGEMAGTHELAMGLYESEEQFEQGEAVAYVDFTDHEQGLATIRRWLEA